MFKTLTTLIRGAAAKAEEDFADRHALLILDQQIRDAASATDGAKRALSIAIAQDESEGKRLEATLKRIADLEERATAALADGRDDLATEAAEAVALMESDRDAIEQSRRSFAADVAQLKTAVANAGHRLAELERGRRIALATESVRRLKTRTGVGGNAGSAALAEAERTLKRLRERQVEEAAAATAYDTLAPGLNPDATASRLEAAGYGRRTRATAADVLDRLRKKTAAAHADGVTDPQPLTSEKEYNHVDPNRSGQSALRIVDRLHLCVLLRGARHGRARHPVCSVGLLDQSLLRDIRSVPRAVVDHHDQDAA